MSINIVLAALLAIAAVIAGAAAIRFLQTPAPGDAGRPASAIRRRTQGATARFGRRQVIIVVGAVAGGLLLALLTGWVAAIVVLPALAIVLPLVLAKPDRSGEAQLEALADWTRKVASLIASNKPLNEAIKESLRSTSPVIKPQVKLLVTRLNAHQPTVDAIYAFGKELDPRAGPVIGALVLGAGAGQAGLTSILASIAQMFTNEVYQLRRIDKERAEGRNTARGVTVASILFITAVMFTPYGSAYRTPLGQLILLVIVALFIGILWLMRTMLATPPVSRIIIQPGEGR